jgi:hypothetical protein
VHFICIPKAHTYISRNTFVVILAFSIEISNIKKERGDSSLHREKERKKKQKQNASLLGRCLPDV